MNWFQIKAFVNKLKNKNMDNDFNTKPGFVEKRMAQMEAELSKLKTELKEWEELTPVNNMGKWARQTRIESLTKQIDEIENIKK